MILNFIRYLYRRVLLVILCIPRLLIKGFQLCLFLKVSLQSFQFLLFGVKSFLSLNDFLFSVLPFRLNFSNSCIFVLPSDFGVKLYESEDKSKIYVVCSNGGRLKSFKIFVDSLAFCIRFNDIRFTSPGI